MLHRCNFAMKLVCDIFRKKRKKGIVLSDNGAVELSNQTDAQITYD